MDVTQFVNWPARSGIQRALALLARNWPGQGACFVARRPKGFIALTAAEFADIAQEYVAHPDSRAPAEILAGRGPAFSKGQLPNSPLLLPEPTYDRATLQGLRARLAGGAKVTAIAYDALPMTHPGVFPGNGHASTSPYFRLLRACSLAIGTSDSVTRTLIERLRRPADTTATAWLGMDHFDALSGCRRPRPGRFLMIGTVEPRKRIGMALDAVERIAPRHPSAHLVLVGREGWEEPQFLSRLRNSVRSGRVTWLDACSDEQLGLELQQAAALLALGDEGFGLPVAEALASGCPVIFAGDQPVARHFEGGGSWRVKPADASNLAAELASWCDPSRVEAGQRQVDFSQRTNWSDFAATVHSLSSG